MSVFVQTLEGSLNLKLEISVPNKSLCKTWKSSGKRNVVVVDFYCE